MAGGGSHSIHTFEVHRKNPVPLKVYTNMAKRWAPSVMGFGAFAGCMFLYFTDWKIFMDKVPFYNKKFEPRETLI